MKLVKLFAVLFITLSLVSCGGDDDNTDNGPVLENSEFAGTYALKFFESSATETRIINGQQVVSTFVSVGDTFTNSAFVFNENGTYTFDVSYRQVTTTTVANNDPVTEAEIITDSGSGTYSLSEANQTITIDDGVFDVVLFSNSELRLTIDEIEVDGDVTTETSSEIRFDRT